MSDEEDEEEDEEEEEEEEDEDGDEDGDEDEDGDGEEEDGDGDSQENEDEQKQGGEEQQNQQQQNQEQDQANEKLPKFKAIQSEQFKFHSLLSEISNLSLSVDHLIDSFPSRGSRGTFSREARDRYIYHSSLRDRQRDRLEQRQRGMELEQRQSRVVVMKDEDVQVSMQPQIIIQPTKVAEQKAEYRISNESNKFLAQLYEQNKRLKRWQGGALTGSGFPTNGSRFPTNGSRFPTSGSGFYNPREKFERKDYEKGLFDVEGRNQEIDRAIELLKREE